MTINVTNQDPYLRTSWHFTNDLQALVVELTRSFNEVAICVNMRGLGQYSTNFPAVAGELWYLAGSNQEQQTLRQVYPITGAGNYAHNINVASIGGFTHIYGTGFDGTNYFPLPYVDSTAANNQIQIKVTSTNIVITSGGGSPPNLVSGLIVLEWLSQRSRAISS